MTQLRLLSLDFDGTMVGPWQDGKAAVSEELISYLGALRKAGVLLAMNTGRTLPLVDQAVELFPVTPDFALTTEREMFRWTAAGWEPFSNWNDRCQQDHQKLFSDAGLLLAEIEEYVVSRRKTRLHREFGLLVGLVAQTDIEMDCIVDYLESRRGQVENFSFQRNSVYLRFCHVIYNKGSVLKALQAQLGIRPDETFAAGDNFNDLPMLDPEVAGHLACPANSVDEVKEAVRRHGGYIADFAGGDGVAQALRRICPQLASQKVSI